MTHEKLFTGYGEHPVFFNSEKECRQGMLKGASAGALRLFHSVGSNDLPRFMGKCALKEYDICLLGMPTLGVPNP